MVGFQAAEKLLKAALAALGVAYPFTHRLGRLLVLLRDAGSPVPERLSALTELTPFAGELRYEVVDDDGSLRLGTEQARALLSDLRTWVADLVGRQDWTETPS